MAIQKDYAELGNKYTMIGKYGCYFLCLLHVANKENKAIEYYDKYLKLKYIDEECTVLRPDLILLDLLKKNYNVAKREPNLPSDYYSNKRKYIIVEYWFNPNTKLHHFKLPNWDPYGNSRTVAEGFIESTRVFEFVGSAA